MRVLYTRLSVEEALERLADATKPYQGFWNPGGCSEPDSSGKEAWSRVREHGFEMGLVGSGPMPLITTGSVEADEQMGATRVSYQLYGSVAFTLVQCATLAAVSILARLLLPLSGDGRLAMWRRIGIPLVGVALATPLILLLAHGLWGRKSRRLEELLKEILEASEQPPASEGRAWR